jgi:hypothetical protein
MKAKHMTVRRGRLAFYNGATHLVVRRVGDYLVDMVKWPGRPRQRPTTQEEMEKAVDDYLAWPDRTNDAANDGTPCADDDDDDPMPVFVIKAKDKFGPAAVRYYRSLCLQAGLHEHVAEVSKAHEEMDMWRKRHPERIQLPDHKHVGASPKNLARTVDTTESAD